MELFFCQKVLLLLIVLFSAFLQCGSNSVDSNQHNICMVFGLSDSCSSVHCPSFHHCLNGDYPWGDQPPKCCPDPDAPFLRTSGTTKLATTSAAVPVVTTTKDANNVHFLQITLSIYSGNLDPVFNIFYTNANFSTIVAKAKSCASVPLNGILGYRGFQVTLYSHAGSQTVIIGKCSDPSFEEKLLQTIARLTDTTGARLVSSTITAVENAIKACH